MIQDLIDAVAAKAGLTGEQARLGLSAALALIEKHADPVKASALMTAIPGASDLAAEGVALTQKKAGGLMGGLMRQTGGAAGAAMSDAMAINQRLSREGITVSDMQSILPVAMTFVREKTGSDMLREVLVSIPGLGPLLAPHT